MSKGILVACCFNGFVNCIFCCQLSGMTSLEGMGVEQFWIKAREFKWWLKIFKKPMLGYGSVLRIHEQRATESVGYYQHYVVRNELNIVPSNCFFNLLAVQGMLIVDTNSNFIGTWSRRHEAVAEVIWCPEVDIVDKFVQNHFSYGHQFFLSVLILIPNAQLGLGNCCIHAGWLMSHSYWDFATLIDQFNSIQFNFKRVYCPTLQ